MNRDPRGYYAALHVTPDATPAEIQRAFRALMRLRHPDVGATAETGTVAADDVRRILESFAVLRNPNTRAEYDPGRNAAGSAGTATGSTGRNGSTGGAAGAGSREVPVRHHRTEQPVLRVTPVRWERGPW
ncbi:MAG TPA: J domain-containing protein [Arthrobacter sp.]|nr:J domain-containing protein [Arthrobacter sp.]